MAKKLVMYLEDESFWRSHAKDTLMESQLSDRIELLLFDNFKALEKELERRQPDLLILDNELKTVKSNGATKGAELLPKYLAMHPGLRVVMFPALADKEFRNHATDKGAFKTFSKMTSFEELVFECLEA